MDFSHKKVVVMGLGNLGGGIGTARFFAKAGADVLITDQKKDNDLEKAKQQLQDLPVTFVFGRHREEDFTNADLIVKNPAVASNSPFITLARKHKIPIEMAESLFMKLSPTKNIIGVTGTRGKSTTSTLMYEVLRKAGKQAFLAGNIKGTSTLELLKEVNEESFIVLELSSWMLESFGWHKISPRYAIITNVYPDHLNRYPSMEAYVADKKNIYAFQTKDDYLVLNKDNNYSREFAQEAISQVHWFSKDDINMPVKLRGEHNKANIAAALTIANLLKVPEKLSFEVLSSFTGLPHRLETVAVIDDTTFINDSASTTPIAGVTALKAFEGKNIILITGGNSKNIPLDEFIHLANEKAKHVIIFDGTARPDFDRITKKSGPVPIGSMEEAVKEAWKYARPGDIVLFSPATTHLPIMNEFERGDHYKKAVFSLQKIKRQHQNNS